jgi:hypothetical protein
MNQMVHGTRAAAVELDTSGRVRAATEGAKVYACDIKTLSFG